ncbi:hypothetical protein Tco_0864297 [Tanacetum coccineum]
MMRKRITIETSKGCLGNLEHREDFDPDEDQNDIDLYKGLDVYIQPLSERKPVTKELTGDDREDAVSMEVDETENEKEKQTENVKEQQAEKEEKQDDIGKGTEEARSETKNDGEEVHAKFDDPNEQMKDKEANKQKMNDRNENEKDKQDEFGNKEYDLTECEELEYQATQDIKKKKTTNRKSPEDMTPPAFSLGLTPEEFEPIEKEKEKQVEKRAKDLSQLESEPKPKQRKKTILISCFSIFKQENFYKRKSNN